MKIRGYNEVSELEKNTSERDVNKVSRDYYTGTITGKPICNRQN